MRSFKLGSGASTDAVLLMFIKLVTMLLGLTVTRLLSEHLSVHDYGTYAQILLVISTVANFTILGMMDGVNFFYSREADSEKREKYISTIFCLQCGISTVAGALVLCLTKPLCAYFDNQDVAGLLCFAAVLPLLQNLLGMFQVLLVSVGKARILAVRNLLVSLARLAAVLVVVLVVQKVVIVFSVTLLLDLIQILLFRWILRRSDCKIRLRKVDFRVFGEIFSYCAPMAVFTLVSSLNRDLDKYLVAWMAETETLAVYTNAAKKLPFDVLIGSFTTVLIPQMTRRISCGAFSEAGKLYRMFLEIGYISTGILCVAALCVSPQLMQLLYSAKYMSGLTIFCIYILVDLLLFTNITLILSAAGKTRTLMVLGMGSLAANAVLNLVLYSWMGVAGPAVATLAITGATGLVMMILNAKTLKTRLGELFDWRKLLLFVAESAAVLIAMTALRKWLEARWDGYFPVLLTVGALSGIVMVVLQGKPLLGAIKAINRITK